MSGPIVKNGIEVVDEIWILFNSTVSGHHIYTRRNVVAFGVQDTVQHRASNVVKLAVLVVGPIRLHFTVSNRALPVLVVAAVPLSPVIGAAVPAGGMFDMVMFVTFVSLVTAWLLLAATIA